MNEMNKEHNFVAYDYLSITVDKDMETLYTDSYENFGWKIESSTSGINNTLTIKFKRDRKIRNKTELTRLQRQFDAIAKEIATMEKSKTSTAFISALAIGLVGTAFMTGSVFAVTNNLILLCAILAIPAFIGWALPYFCFNYIRQKKTNQINPYIEQKYDELYMVCEKASSMLN